MEAKVKVMGDFSRVSEEEMQFINKHIERFEQKHATDFHEMLLKLDCHVHKETSRGRPAYYCAISLASDKGRFSAENQDFGAEKAIVGAIDKIDKQVEKLKGHNRNH